MSIDQFIAKNEPSWQRLEVLAKSARRRRPRLSPEELDEFVGLYQRTSTHLSHVRTHYRDPGLTMHLTAIVADANGAIYGRAGHAGRAVGAFFASTFPAAVWSGRRFLAASALLLFGPAIVMAIWLAHSDAAVSTLGDDAALQAYTSTDFEAYYSSAPAAQFSTEVLVNNIQVSFLAFAAGIALCVGTAYFLVSNGINVGLAAGLFYNVDEAQKFWGLILPHGLLELTAIVIAGSAGLRMGWAIIAPGDRRRVDALADEGRRSVVVVIGLILAFIVAGLIEGFVTPSSLSTSARVGIGIVVESAFVLYLATRGSAATARGLTGQWGESPDR